MNISGAKVYFIGYGRKYYRNEIDFSGWKGKGEKNEHFLLNTKI